MQYKALVRRHGVAISLCMVGCRYPEKARRFYSTRHIFFLKKRQNENLI